MRSPGSIASFTAAVALHVASPRLLAGNSQALTGPRSYLSSSWSKGEPKTGWGRWARGISFWLPGVTGAAATITINLGIARNTLFTIRPKRNKKNIKVAWEPLASKEGMHRPGVGTPKLLLVAWAIAIPAGGTSIISGKPFFPPPAPQRGRSWALAVIHNMFLSLAILQASSWLMPATLVLAIRPPTPA